VTAVQKVPALPQTSTEAGKGLGVGFFPNPTLAKRAGQGLFFTDRLSLRAVWHLSRETADCTIWVSEQPHSSNPSKFPGCKCHGEVGGNRALCRAKQNSLIQTTTCPL